MYKVLNNVYGKKYYQISGENIKRDFGIDSEPDYYIRDGKNIYLFESKDILIPSTVKTSNDFTQIRAELRKRLYYDNEEKGKHRGKAVLQLLNNIQKLLSMEAAWDYNYDVKGIEIFPIIVLYDNIYNCPGLNELINLWFVEEIKKLSQSFDRSRIHKITIINIDVFIVYQDLLCKEGNELSSLITAYDSHVSHYMTEAGKIRFGRKAFEIYQKGLVSFETFLSFKFKPNYKYALTRIIGALGQ